MFLVTILPIKNARRAKGVCFCDTSFTRRAGITGFINTGRELRADEIGSTGKTTCLLVVRSWFPICVGCDINILSALGVM